MNDEKVQAHLGRIKSSVDRASSMIEGIRNQTRLKEPALSPLYLRDVIKEVISLANVPAGITVATDYPETPLTVNADRSQLLVAFQNIVKNAIEAMEGGGTLGISLKQTDKHAVLTFTDTGVGIPPENMGKIFSLLFTTKMQGTGFGLPITKKIIQAHGGTIEITSKAGVGTTVTISFPLNKTGNGQNN